MEAQVIASTLFMHTCNDHAVHDSDIPPQAVALYHALPCGTVAGYLTLDTGERVYFEHLNYMDSLCPCLARFIARID